MGKTTLVERRFTFGGWWWLATAAIVFLALWGWRELGMRVSNERVASRDAEIRQLQEENARLSEQVSKLEIELANTATTFTIAGLQKGTARVFLDASGHGLLVTSDVPKGRYALRIEGNAQPIATIDVPASGEKTATLDHLPAQNTIKSFTLTAR